MFKSKSFDLINEEKDKKSERFYQPRRMRWMKYIVIPAGCGFILMLILCNVDFSYEVTDNGNLDTNTVMPNQTRQLWDITFCTLDDSAQSQCKLSCDAKSGILKKQLINKLEQQQLQCDVGLQLCILNADLPNGILEKNMLEGAYQLESLSIINSTLVAIEDDALQQDSLEHLLSLELQNTQLTELDKDCFKGLKSLRNFTLINKGDAFIPGSFLVPLAETLSYVFIKVQGTFTAPVNWFGSAVYKLLKIVDLRGNSFVQLNATTFKRMPQLERLVLADCGLISVELDLLIDNLHTLLYLDLSKNQLTTLRSEFFLVSSLSLELAGNLWDCSCLNAQLLSYTQNKQQYLEEPQCATPAVHAGKAFSSLQLYCQIEDITEQVTAPTRAITTVEPTKLEETNDVPTAATKDSTTRTTTVDTDMYAQMVCVDTAGKETQTKSVVYDAIITVYDVSNIEVQVDLSQLKEEGTWNLMYFTDQALQGQMIVGYTFSSVKVEHLQCSTPYMFCLILDENVTSPYNCRSHRTMSCIQAWFEAHCTLIIGIGIGGILLCVAIGIFSVYGILRMRPNMLRGSKRLVRPNRDTHKMMLLPRGGSTEDSYAIRHTNSITNNYDYIAYYRHLEQNKLLQMDSNKYNVPPRDRAPSAPPSSKQDDESQRASTETTTSPNSNVYECTELYEELY